jgi:hypothetical protein
MTACVVRLLADTAVDMGNPTPGEINKRQTFDFHFKIKHFFFSLKMGRVSSEQPARLVSVRFSLIYTIWVIANALARFVYLWLVPSVEGVFSEWFTMATSRPPAIRCSSRSGFRARIQFFLNVSFRNAAVVGQPTVVTSPKAKRCALDDKLFGRTLGVPNFPNT